jgi:hypothetical protein
MGRGGRARGRGAGPPRPEEGEKTITCPMCGSTYPEREPEAPYTCMECGGEGLDCCVPGNNAICVNCEERGDG